MLARVGRKRPYTDKAVAAFGDALRDALTTARKTQNDLADTLGVKQPTVSAWVMGQNAPEEPSQVFRIERALAAAPGALSRHLGFLPPEAVRHSPTVIDSIMTDPGLNADEKEMLAGAYKAALRRKAAKRGRPNKR